MSDSVRIPLFPLGVVLFPDMLLPLHIFEERYKEMINLCIQDDLPFGVLLYLNGQLCQTGCSATVKDVLKKYEDGRMDILSNGVKRFNVHGIVEEKSYLEADVTFFDDEEGADAFASPELIEEAGSFLRKILLFLGQDDEDSVIAKLSPQALSFMIASHGVFTLEEKQRFLETLNTSDRLQAEVDLSKMILKRLNASKKMAQTLHSNGKLVK